MNDLSNSHDTSNGATGAPMPPFNPAPTGQDRARVVVSNAAWTAASDIARGAVRNVADSISVVFDGEPGGPMSTEPLVTGGEAMDRFTKQLRILGIEFEVVADSTTTATPLTLKEAAEQLNEKPAEPPQVALESRVWISKQSWARLKEKVCAKIYAADRESMVELSSQPSGAMATKAFSKGDVRIVAFASALEGLKVPHSVLEAPAGESPAEPADPPAPAKTPRGAARKARRTEADGEDEDGDENDTSLDLAIAHVMGGDFADALRIVLKAAPKRGASPAISHVVIASDTERKRLELAAHDGCRYHLAFVPTSAPIEMPAQAIQLRNARSLLKSVEYAVKERKLGARVGFIEHTGSPTRLVISCGKPQPLSFLLKLAAKGEPDGWRPPKFSRGGDVTSAEHDARAITDATAWKGARVTRDECDGVGRRHITLMNQTGTELMRAVIVASGLTEGLPEDPQLEIAGALSTPKKKRGGKKSEQLPLATGPAVRGKATGQWRLETSTDGRNWSTRTTGTESEIADLYAKRDRKVFARTIDPQGIVAKSHDGRPAKASAADTAKVAKPATKKPARKLDSNVTTGGRKPKAPKRNAIADGGDEPFYRASSERKPKAKKRSRTKK
jgi:hypothetical protein